MRESAVWPYSHTPSLHYTAVQEQPLLLSRSAHLHGVIVAVLSVSQGGRVSGQERTGHAPHSASSPPLQLIKEFLLPQVSPSFGNTGSSSDLTYPVGAIVERTVQRIIGASVCILNSMCLSTHSPFIYDWDSGSLGWCDIGSLWVHLNSLGEPMFPSHLNS